MNALSWMSPLPTWLDLHNVTSSPESASGATPCGCQGGATVGQSGQEAARASPSPMLEKGEGSMMNDTSGPSGSISFASAGLRLCLESKLRQRLDLNGSIWFKLTWKQRATPSGRLIFALRASAHPTSDSGFTSWVTPNTRDWKDTSGQTMKAKNPDGSDRHRVDQIPRQAFLMSGQENPSRIRTDGTILTGSRAGMDATGRYKPEHSRWVMGIPTGWDGCAPTVMPSSRK